MQKFRVGTNIIIIFLNNFIHQGHNTFIKVDSKDTYNVKKIKIKSVSNKC